MLVFSNNCSLMDILANLTSFIEVSKFRSFPLLSLHSYINLSDQMLEMLCKGQLSTLIMDGRESSHSVDVFFVKIVIE